MSIGKRTLTQSLSSERAHKIDPYAAVQMRIDHAEVLLRELSDDHVPALRRAIEGRSLDSALTADVHLRREIVEAGRELREAQRLARALEDEVSTERATRLEAVLVALVQSAQPLLALAPAHEPAPEIILIAHVPGDSASFRVEQAERARAWFEKLDRAEAGITDLAARRDRSKDRR